jgi:CheY-like chemotaxis protein
MRTILIAHRDRAVRDRFAAALSDAHHSFVPAGDATEAGVAMADTGRPMSLLLVDLGLAEDGVALIKRFRLTAGRSVPVVVFSGSISSASQVAALAALASRGSSTSMPRRLRCCQRWLLTCFLTTSTAERARASSWACRCRTAPAQPSQAP